ncbi:hypothetical protein BVG16_25505 [Paenibacillus selenitireducens]|uniref:BioF2-like acetyltransferase domain-containing protein n=1 Tax=Paenibacillus selenitireducens TaxID=1324314 RepID=A0A1T2X2M5_9BACL|nr:GNAT family N-acetyltransferase [Paenibacillus selenitireducens]OPA74109.1 hypothetical protein BVG16_25505 [Paenibacillus selenitireducens]
MNTRIIKDSEEFRSIQADWERLEQLDQDATFYSTFQYNYTWWETYRQHGQLTLFIICCYHEGKITGIAPLMIRRADKLVFSCHTLCFLGKGDYFNFLIDYQGDQAAADILAEMFGEIQRNKNSWDKIELTHLEQNTRLLHYLWRQDQYNEHVKYLTSCPTIDLEKYHSFDAFIRSKEYTKAKKSRDKFTKSVNYRFKVIVGTETDEIYERVSKVHRAQKDYMQQHKGRTERRSLFENKLNEDFLKKLFKDNEQVVTFLMEDAEGDIIIYSISYVHNGILYDWNSGYAPQYAAFHGLSNILFIETAQYLYQHSIGKKIDCGAGSYAWKFKWTDQFKINYSLKMWNMSKFKSRLFRLVAGLYTLGHSGLLVIEEFIVPTF